MEKLGSGGYGSVFKTTKHGKNVAMKLSKMVSFEISGLNELREVDISTRLRHPYVNQILDYSLRSVISDNYSKYSVIYPFADGTLYTLNKNIIKSNLSAKYLIKYFLQLLLGLKYVHERGIILADIKPSNILFFKKEDEVRFNDFGLSVYDDLIFKEIAYGTTYYAAPELLFSPHTIFKESDTWSLGMTFIEIWTGILPQEEVFKNRTSEITKEIYRDNISKKINETLDLIKDKEVKYLISRMLVFDYKKRAKLDELISLKMFNDYRIQVKNIEKIFDGCQIEFPYINAYDLTKFPIIYKTLKFIYSKLIDIYNTWSWFNAIDIINNAITLDFVNQNELYVVLAAFILSLKIIDYEYYDFDNVQKFINPEDNIDMLKLNRTEALLFVLIRYKVYRRNIYSFLYNQKIKFDTNKLADYVLTENFEGELTNYTFNFLKKVKDKKESEYIESDYII